MGRAIGSGDGLQTQEIAYILALCLLSDPVPLCIVLTCMYFL